ncbi:MAG: 7-cyano-7-deazaguanine synthase [Planctomycetota bacterium]|nr:MAG: 7-cyano-7-deazaguanine synthase [Planctomycetota bacterium]
MQRIAVLASGGLDSSVLLVELAREAVVFPVHVAMGMIWEAEELTALRRFIARVGNPNIQPVTELALPIGPVYGTHWSLSGRGVPSLGTPDEDVYLPGRNLLLLGLAGVWGSLQGVSAVAIGSLACNPFPDGSTEFFASYAQVMSQGLAHPLQVLAPYRGVDKHRLIQRFHDLPLELTLTCMQPVAGVHCGRCSKCGERHQAFVDAGVVDRTAYTHPLKS